MEACCEQMVEASSFPHITVRYSLFPLQHAPNSWYQVQWLSSADEIVVLDRDGTVSGKGNLEVLSQSNDYVRELLESQNRIADAEADDNLPADVGDSAMETMSP